MFGREASKRQGLHLLWRGAAVAAFFLTGALNASVSVWTLSSWERALRSTKEAPLCEVKLWASRNEWESFQIALRGTEACRILRVRWSNLKGPGKAVIEAKNVRFYRAHQLEVRRGTYRNREFQPGWYPDALVPTVHPLEKTPLSGGRYRALPFDLPPGETHTFWVDIFVPRGTEPGVYRGSCTVVFARQSAVHIPVTLEVWPSTLPERPFVRTQFGSPALRIASWYRQQKHAGRISTEPDRATLFEICSRLAAEHRINAAAPPELLRAPLRQDGSFELTERQRLQLRAFCNKYHVNALSVSPPHRFFKDPKKEKDRIVSYLRSYDRIVADLGIADLLCYTYLIDEPNDEKAYEFTRKWGRLIRSARSVVKVLVTEQTKPQSARWGNLYGAVDIWVPLFSLFDPAWARKRQEAGEEIWTYTALCQGKPTPWWHLDFPLYHYRIPCWIAWCYGQKGLLYWGGMAYWSGDMWREPDTYPRKKKGPRRHIFNGEGTLLYPADPVGFQGAVPSMRLKALRDGLEDFDLLTLLGRHNLRGEAEKLLQEVTPDWYTWSRRAGDYIETRKAVGLLLSRKRR